MNNIIIKKMITGKSDALSLTISLLGSFSFNELGIAAAWE